MTDEGISSSVLTKSLAVLRAYPYRERIPGVAFITVIFLGLLRTGLHFTPTEKIALCAFAFAGLFRVGGRVYLFVLGFAAGALMSDVLPKLSSLFIR
jgi:hypothetical protein